MKKILAILLLAVSFSSCHFIMHDQVEGNGDLVKKERHLGQASRIRTSDGIDVVIMKGEPKIEVEADANLHRYIEIKNTDGWLTIRAKEDTELSSENKITVYVTTPELRALKVAGSGNIESDEDWEIAGTFDLDVAGSGDVFMSLRARMVKADIAGSGNVDIRGEAGALDLDIAGSGSFKGSQLKCDDVKISVAGSGEADVYAEEKLDVSVAGSGDVRYKGNASVEEHIAGSGSVRKMD